MKEIELKYSGTKVNSFIDIITAFGESEFKSHTRSTVPFLQFWRNPESRFKELASHLKIEMSESTIFDFEHKVSTVLGRGKASHTDLKIISDNFSITIEAKYLEGRYDTCKKWLNDTKNPENKKLVLEGWIKLLNNASEKKFGIDDVKELPYQVIHRAASACHNPKDKQVLIYQLFDSDEKKRNMYLNDLKRLTELLGNNSKLNVYFLDCLIEKTRTWTHLTKKWKDGERDLSNQTITGLLNGDLIKTNINYIIMINNLI